MLAPDGRPLALAAVRADDRTHQALFEAEVLRLLHGRHGTGAFETWLGAQIDDCQAREALNSKIARDSAMAADTAISDAAEIPGEVA